MSGREESIGIHNRKKDLTLVLYQGLFFCYSIGNLIKEKEQKLENGESK